MAVVNFLVAALAYSVCYKKCWKAKVVLKHYFSATGSFFILYIQEKISVVACFVWCICE